MLILAAQAGRSAEGAGAIAITAILLIVLVGIIVILLLGVTWRRYNQRINKSQSSPDKTEHTDLWQAAADRLDPAPGDSDPESPAPGNPEDPEDPDEPDTPGYPDDTPGYRP